MSKISKIISVGNCEALLDLKLIEIKCMKYAKPTNPDIISFFSTFCQLWMKVATSWCIRLPHICSKYDFGTDFPFMQKDSSEWLYLNTG